MSKKAIFDYHKVKSILKEKGIIISQGKLATENGLTRRAIIDMSKGVSKQSIFLNNICEKYSLKIQDVITIKEE